jgi:hypothetical protein
VSFLASAHATLSPPNLLSHSAEMLMPLGDPVSDPVQSRYLIYNQPITFMRSPGSYTQVFASLPRCATPVARLCHAELVRQYLL